MSYNKLKSLVANVEAIETAMKIQVQGRQATAEEKEILSRYSGFGGIKEVLNIGTDKPIYNPQNEMFRLLGTKRSFSQNETFFFSHPYPPTLPFST